MYHSPQLEIAASTEAELLARSGRLVGPAAAMYAACRDRHLETLWSIASRIAEPSGYPVSALHAYLEDRFPQFAARRINLTAPISRADRMASLFSRS